MAVMMKWMLVQWHIGWEWRSKNDTKNVQEKNVHVVHM